MRSLSWAVVIFPSMSVLRGFFQGFNNMKPYALSQIAEQIIRVIWMLLATFFIMKIGTGDYVTAVVQSTFAAFIGMLASYGVLFFYLWKEGKLKSLLVSRPFILISIQLQLLLRHLRKPFPSLLLDQRFNFSSWLINGLLSVLWRGLQAIVIVSFRFSMLICLQTQVRLLWFWLPLLFLLLGSASHFWQKIWLKDLGSSQTHY